VGDEGGGREGGKEGKWAWKSTGCHAIRLLSSLLFSSPRLSMNGFTHLDYLLTLSLTLNVSLYVSPRPPHCRFQRILEATGIAKTLKKRGAKEGESRLSICQWECDEQGWNQHRREQGRGVGRWGA